MKTAIFSFFVTALFYAVPGWAQQSDASPDFVFDPLFWRDDLKLSSRQCWEIEQINSEFYTSLIDNSRSTNTGDIRARSRELLKTRSNLIWNVFSNRQKVKWKKIGNAYYEKQQSWHSIPSFLKRVSSRPVENPYDKINSHFVAMRKQNHRSLLLL